ncbi:MFS transporter [Kluyvera intermedia]|uniref:MFS transporter n=1 Tax=Kluyvera intermedia TaxID=61648 RepID=UPI00242B9EA5|nr:MFS transporter [Kluyvera intermedia]WEJ85004.1 MAG: MFS transporter [Kluyvera intermedia]
MQNKKQKLLQQELAKPSMSKGLIFLFTLSGAAAIGNLYWAQPLLGMISRSFGIPIAQSGSLITFTQLGYALGILLLMPLGDALNRRYFIPLLMALSAVFLLVSAIAPVYWSMLAGLALVGVTSLGGQLLLPLAGDLTRHDERGRVIGIIASGMLIGTMLSRLMGGIIADWFGWRSTYLAAALVDACLAVILLMRLPNDKPRPRIAYGKLLFSIVGIVRNSRPVQTTIVLGACTFAVYTMFWTGLTFLLSAPPFSFTPTQIGLLNLVGLAGSFAAKNAGKFHDKGRSTPVTGLGLATVFLALIVAPAGSQSVAVIIVSTLLFNFAMQIVFVLSQTRLLSMKAELRSRLNTAYVVFCFIAGAAGSMVAGSLWQSGGWTLLISGEVAVIILALLFWFFQRSTLKSIEVTNSDSFQ